MKKFMKYSAITALVMIVLGIIMTSTAMIVKGPETITLLTQHSSELLNTLGGDVLINVAPDLNFDSDIPMLSANTQQTIDGTGITKLDMELGSCKLQILPSEDQYYYAHTDSAGICQVYSDDETLVVKAGSGAITLYIPDNFYFEEIKISLGAGEINSNSAFRTENLEVELAAGEINLTNVEVGDLSTEVGAGSLSFAGSVLQSVDAECGMGNLSLELTGAQTDYNYDVDVAAGNVTIGNESFSGIAGDREINNNASKNVTVECALGNIDISFCEN